MRSALFLRPACTALSWLQNAVADSLTACSCAAGLRQPDHHMGSGSWGGGAVAATANALQLQRHKHTVRMVLLKDHDTLGKRGDIVKVKAGHARYMLFPTGQADYALATVLRQLRDQGFWSEEALAKMRGGAKQSAAAGPADASTLPLEQQLPQLVQLLSSQTLVVSRRFNRRLPEQPLLDPVTPQQISAHVAQQLHIDLPPALILMEPGQPITSYGSFKVPLGLKDEQGQQVELSLTVRKTYRGSRLRRLRLFRRGGAAAAQAAQQRQPSSRSSA